MPELIWSCIDAFAGYLYPPLTSVTQPLAEVADRAVALLTDLLDEPDSGGSPPSAVLPTRLTTRDSTRAPVAPPDRDAPQQATRQGSTGGIS